MNKTVVIKDLTKKLKKEMSGESTGHDWFHIQRVVTLAKQIGKKEKADLFIVELASLLHEVGDWKLISSSKTQKELLNEILSPYNLPKEIFDEVLHIVSNMSFSKNLGKKNKLSLEGRIVQDADRLDALGAIGIARAFAYGGKKQREIYNPKTKPRRFTSSNAYKNAKSSTINHFYEKLFLLKDM